MTLGIVIMHAAFDERRAEHLAYMRANLPPSVEVIRDHEKVGPWPVAKRCFEWGLGEGTDHLLVLQDDIILCPNFIPAVEEIARQVPDQIVSLFYGPRTRFDPFYRYNLAEGPWGQAVLYPVDLIPPMLSWVETHIKPDFKSYDARVALWMVATKRKCWVTMPSLVDHNPDMKSVTGHAGKRQGPYFIGNDDPMVLDWSDMGAYADGSRSLAQYNRWFL